MLVSMYMTADPVTVAPGDDIAAAVARMEQHAVRCLPVVDGGRLCGVVSRSDLARMLPAGSNPFSPEARVDADHELEVGDVMVGHVVTVSPDDPIDTAVSLLDLHKLSMVVVARGREVVGVLSRSDILRAFRDVVFAPTATRISMLVSGDADVIGGLLDSAAFHRLRLRAYAEHPHQDDRLVEISLEGPTDAVDEVMAQAWCERARVLHVRRPEPVGN